MILKSKTTLTTIATFHETTAEDHKAFVCAYTTQDGILQLSLCESVRTPPVTGSDGKHVIDENDQLVRTKLPGPQSDIHIRRVDLPAFKQFLNTLVAWAAQQT